MAMILASLFLLVVINSSNGAKLLNCQRDQIKFEKVIGLRPPNSFHPLLLHKSRAGPVTVDCIRKCQENDECLSFVLYYKNSSCFWFRDEMLQFQEERNVLDPDVAWFQKTCLKVKGRCQRLWTMERVPGAILVGNNTKKLPNLMSREQCQQNCLNETRFSCRSMKFFVQSFNHLDTPAYQNPLDKYETQGYCVLSESDRFLSSNSYRVSSFDDEYFENECAPGIMNEFCAFEEYENLILSHTDLVYNGLTKISCQKKCESLEMFKCRGYSLLPTSKMSIQTNQEFICLLHSENSKLHGPKALQEHAGAKYYERAPCLNISVSCSDDEILIKFTPDVAFNGRLYMKGYSESPECYAIGRGLNTVALKLPLAVHTCGILESRSSLNRTLMSSTLILQYNALVQTQADRIIKVGCVFGNNTKVVVGTTFNFTDDHTSSGTNLINSSASLPVIELRIVDLATHNEVSDTQIGDELQLIIAMQPGNNGIDMWAGHLVAMTENGQDSILLLDDRGCPTNLDVFPGLTKTVTNSTITLSSTFQAFKFSSSNVIRFSVIVQFCAIMCPIVDCGGTTFNKRKREAQLDGSRVDSVNYTQFQEQGMKLPLEFVLIVRNTNAKPDKLVYGDKKLLVAGFDYETNEVCIDFSLLMGVIVTWIFIQIILLVSCIILLRRYKKHYENQLLNESLEELHKNFGLGFSNLDANRRVHFADGHLT